MEVDFRSAMPTLKTNAIVCSGLKLCSSHYYKQYQKMLSKTPPKYAPGDL